MNYTDNLFIVLFLLLVIGSFFFKAVSRVKEGLILAFSFLVLGSWGFETLAVFLVAVIVNYFFVVAISRYLHSRAAKLIVAAAISADVIFLGYFKYEGFFAENAGYVFGLTFAKQEILKPLGISFYTFHAISYLVDVYCGRTKPTSFLKFLFYLSFFPHVIAGPIVRGWQLISQIGSREISKYDLVFGLHYFLLGYFLKVIGANNIALFIDPFWTHDVASSATALDRWAIAFLYYCQIYSDFAGYSLMAIGMARLLGYKLPANFRLPMLAASLREFWRRWHITLSRWLRDYLYIPLGGNRNGGMRTAINLMITMLLGGFWHGANWGFVIWGAMHGSWLVLEHALRIKYRSSSTLLSASWVVTQIWVTIAFVFFRAPDVSFAYDFIAGMFDISSFGQLHLNQSIKTASWFALPALLHHSAPLFLGKVPSRRFAITIGALTAILLLADLIFLPTSQSPFIYFKF